MEPTTLPSLYSVIPFALLLLMIATGPVLYPTFWHRYYVYICCLFASIIASYYLFVLKNYESVQESSNDYIRFVAFIGALYVVSSSVLIEIRTKPSTKVNLAILWLGSTLANLIGTTGASILLIRPYIRINKKHIAPFHIVFFIFMVSNVGGVLTPIGDPPLFLGFLKGVPFFWTLWNGFFPWLLALILLSGAFYYLSVRHKIEDSVPEEVATHTISQKKGIRIGTMQIVQPQNLLLLALVVMSVFLDHNRFPWVPDIPLLREGILVSIAVYTYLRADKSVLITNGFSFEPLKEVMFVFIGIFGTMIPAIQLIEHFVKSVDESYITPDVFYWSTGILSSVLDNAPTYFNFLAAGMASKGLEKEIFSHVMLYATQYPILLRATSLSAVFFGAMTYIGNGPNFMVKAIAESQGVKMPNFVNYTLRYAMPFLLPVLFIIWFVFFYLLA